MRISCTPKRIQCGLCSNHSIDSLACTPLLRRIKELAVLGITGNEKFLSTELFLHQVDTAPKLEDDVVAKPVKSFVLLDHAFDLPCPGLEVVELIEAFSHDG
jgi:hypothetical protein